MTQENFQRVKDRIGELIIQFCATRSSFHMEDLRRYVEANIGESIAPDSPGRILRGLRQRGQINYRVASRSQSLYEIQEVT